jgi:hypothetical protein
MGMWMEGVGSWTGTLMEEARNNWLPSYQYYQAQFLQRWEPLLNMTPVCEMRVIQVGGVDSRALGAGGSRVFWVSKFL